MFGIKRFPGRSGYRIDSTDAIIHFCRRRIGKVTGLVLALVNLQIISNGLNLLQVNAFITRAIWGMILVAVMIGQYYRIRAASRIR